MNVRKVMHVIFFTNQGQDLYIAVSKDNLPIASLT
jgi:hypothetical protein